MDEWVSEDRLDTRKVQYPRKDGASGSVSTPKRVQASTSVTSSRPSSPVPPDTPDTPIINPAFTQIEPKKIVRRKKLSIPSEPSEVKFWLQS